MNIKSIHYVSGFTIAVFIGLHLFNHIVSVFGPERHIAVMKSLRLFYRTIFIESILVLAVLTQIISGLLLFTRKRKIAVTFFDKVQIWSGLYLAIFFVIHLSVVFAGRIFLHLDTNFYFGVAGLNTFPLSLFFVPYYGLAIMSIFGHLAAAHHKKMKFTIAGLTPDVQSKLFLALGAIVTVTIFYGLTNHFKGVIIPDEYKVLTGQ